MMIGKPVSMALLLTGCAAGQTVTAQYSPAPLFDPAAFFSGRTTGVAVLKVAMHRRQHVVVAGQGRIDAIGDIVLDQSVRTGSAPATHRTWTLHRAAPGQWTGTLSDAVGPVTGQVAGNCLHLAFTMKHGFKAQQWLYLQPGKQVVRNVMVVRKWGLPVARLDETITQTPR